MRRKNTASSATARARRRLHSPSRSAATPLPRSRHRRLTLQGPTRRGSALSPAAGPTGQQPPIDGLRFERPDRPSTAGSVSRRCIDQCASRSGTLLGVKLAATSSRSGHIATVQLDPDGGRVVRGAHPESTVARKRWASGSGHDPTRLAQESEPAPQ